MSDQSSVALPTNDKTVVTDASAGTFVCPDFKVSGAFSSHMVLQREKPIRVWGFSTAIGSTVAGHFMGETVKATVEETDEGYGKWVLTFSPHLYCRDGQVMVISDEHGHTVTLEDILIGDVWLIGGQSNAELNLGGCIDLTPSMDFYEEDSFRLFTQTQYYVFTHQELCARPQPDVICADWCWKRPSREASMEFSAMGLFFAREACKMCDVPLGMVMMAAGGAAIRELLPMELAHAEGYDYGAGVCEGGYYNTLINPFVGLNFKGMLFFQGESEGGSRELAEKYTYELALLVADERRRFGFEFPFYNVQLSDYRAECDTYFPHAAMIRAKQYDASRVIPNSTLTVDMDLGSPEDWPDFAHSPRKWELGERLAKLALAREYGIGIEREVVSPTPASAFLMADKRQILIEFDNVSQGLIVSGHAPNESYGMEVHGFTVGDYDNRVPATAVISSRHSVTVDIPEGFPTDAPLTVGYAYFNLITPENADLRGGNNLPCPAFCKVVG